MSMFARAETVPKMFSDLDELGKDGFIGFNTNIIMADNSGNIGYYMMAPVPVRKDKTPYIGCRVLDGTKSDYDWEPNRLTPVTELPRSLNPKKGFLVSANNRQTPDTVKYDHGAQIVPTARAFRITEMIQEGIADGKKFTNEDMSRIQ